MSGCTVHTSVYVLCLPHAYVMGQVVCVSNMCVLKHVAPTCRHVIYFEGCTVLVCIAPKCGPAFLWAYNARAHHANVEVSAVLCANTHSLDWCMLFQCATVHSCISAHCTYLHARHAMCSCKLCLFVCWMSMHSPCHTCAGLARHTRLRRCRFCL